MASTTDVTARHVAEQELRAADRQKDQFLALLANDVLHLIDVGYATMPS